jgi:hypothetical protein
MRSHKDEYCGSKVEEVDKNVKVITYHLKVYDKLEIKSFLNLISITKDL